MRLILVTAAVVVCLTLCSTQRSFAQPPLTPEVKRQTVESLADLLPERYAYKEIAPRLQKLLKDNLATGKYDRLTSPMEFSEVVTADLRSVHADRHLALNYSPDNPATPLASTATQVSPEERARRASEFNRQMNYGFKDVRFLYGNVGYLKFDYFDSYLDYSRPVVDASIGFLRNVDALIIDLRENGGGSGEMVNYLLGFFLKERTKTGSSYNRLTDTSTDEYVDPQPREKQLGEIPLYILTSPRTISAAEALAYDLKYLRGAVIVGEVSAGAANPGRVTRLNPLFTAFIPNRHGMNAVTGTNWEGTGVPVDIRVPEEDALRAARIHALTRLRETAKDPQQRAKFAGYITYLETLPIERTLSQKQMQDFTGDYAGGRNIIIKAGKLIYRRVGDASGELHPISSDVFMLAEGDITITFNRDRTSRVVSMAVKWALNTDAVTAARLHE